MKFAFVLFLVLLSAMTMATTKNVQANRQLPKEAHQFMLQHEVSLHAQQPQGLDNCKKECTKCN
ncbi:unnamed protein product, partial [Eruca vesicaria subsp. sativa]|nr:unnamed protein product [Eruca vesicaria subsp. sativa]